MLFQTGEFLIFFLMVLVLLSTLKQRRHQVLMLIGASYVFYMWWNPLFLFPIVFSTLWDYFSALRIYHSSGPYTRKAWLFSSLAIDLGLLGWFKYYGFFADSFNSLAMAAGIHFALPLLNIILPAGISFYTFEAISYTVDVYQGKYKPCTNLIDFTLYLAFFPHLVAGPILRPWDFVPQIQHPITLERNNFRFGAHLFLVGLFKKVIIADNLAPFSDGVLNVPQGQPSLTIFLATMAFGVRIYCDFSGYSDMALGLARTMGIHLPVNFNCPYSALSIRDFWHRWHISLSTWLRDYLYIPLGGNRKGPFRMYVHLMITMLLGGLWHGAAWHFVFWGAYQGFLLCGERFLDGRLPHDSIVRVLLASPPGRVVCWCLTQYLVFLGWIFFRVSGLSDLLYCVRRFTLFDFNFSLGGGGVSPFRPVMTVFILAVFLVFYLSSRMFSAERLRALSLGSRLGLYTAICLVFFLLWPINQVPFIYFQF